MSRRGPLLDTMELAENRVGSLANKMENPYTNADFNEVHDECCKSCWLEIWGIKISVSICFQGSFLRLTSYTGSLSTYLACCLKPQMRIANFDLVNWLKKIIQSHVSRQFFNRVFTSFRVQNIAVPFWSSWTLVWLRLCVFCPAYLLKHIRDFGLCLRTSVARCFQCNFRAMKRWGVFLVCGLGCHSILRLYIIGEYWRVTNQFWLFFFTINPPMKIYAPQEKH